MQQTVEICVNSRFHLRFNFPVLAFSLSYLFIYLFIYLFVVVVVFYLVFF